LVARYFLCIASYLLQVIMLFIAGDWLLVIVFLYCWLLVASHYFFYFWLFIASYFFYYSLFDASHYVYLLMVID